MTIVRFGSVDECLGPGDERFFAQGYKRVQHWVSPIEVDLHPETGATARATAQLSFPTNWSVKTVETVRRPHLTSIDAVVLSIRLLSGFLEQVYQLTPDQQRFLWLRRIAVRAGAKPIENIDEVPMTARIGPESTQAQPGTVTAECRIGSMKVECVIQLPERLTAPDAIRPEASPATDEPGTHYFVQGFKSHERDIHDVALNLGELHASSDVSILGPVCTGGFSGAYQPSFTILDGMLVLAQLSQALLYEIDGITRDMSDNLWMRRFVIECEAPRGDLAAPLCVSTAMTKSQLFLMNGDNWRISDWSADVLGTRYTYGLAHRIAEEAVVSSTQSMTGR